MTPNGNLAIGISLLMRDGFTTQANAASTAMVNLRSNANQLSRQQASLARNSNAAGAAIGAVLVNGMRKAYVEASTFNHTMKYVSMLTDDHIKSYDRLRAKAIEVGKSSTFNPQEVGEGMRQLAQAGLKEVEILETINDAAKLAQATMTELGEKGGAADILTSISRGFNIPLTEANMKKVSNIIAKGANLSAADLNDYAEAMKYTQATAYRLNQTLEGTSAAIMVMHNAGIKGSMAGTAVENLLRYASRAASTTSGKQFDALKSFGLSPKELQTADGHLKSIGDMMITFKKMLGRQTSVEDQNAILDVFGVRGARAAAIMEHIDSYTEFLKALKTQDNYINKMAGGIMSTDWAALEILTDTWKSLKIEFGTSLAPIITPLIQGISAVTDLITAITSSPIGRTFAIMASGFITIKTAQLGYRALMLSIMLIQTNYSSLMNQSGNTTVSNFGRMNTAANVYANTLQRINMLTGASAGVGRVGQYSHGGYYQVGMGGGYTPLRRNSYLIGLNKMNNFMGKVAPYALMGSMGLNLASSAMGGNNSTLGTTTGVLGDTLGYAAMGTMLGSMIPGIGNAIGGIVGGIGGLLLSLHSRLSELNDTVQNVVSEDKSFNGPNADRLKKQLDIYSKLNWKDRAFVDMDTTINGEIMRKGTEGKQWHSSSNKDKDGTTIIINIDGAEAMRRTFDEKYGQEQIDLGTI